MPARRDLLHGLGAVATLTLAGCSGDQKSMIPLGERRTAGGLEVGVPDVLWRDDVALRQDDATTTIIEAGRDTSVDSGFVAVALRLENVTEDRRDLPGGGGSIVISDRERMNDIDPERYQGDFVVDGDPAPMYLELCEREDWWLAPGESIHGWLVFVVWRDFDPETRPLTVDFDGAQLHFALAAESATSPFVSTTIVEE